MCETEDACLASFEQIILSGVFDAVEELSDGGNVGIRAPGEVQVLKTFVRQGCVHGPGDGIEVSGAGAAEDPFIEIKGGMAHFARGGIKKTYKGFFVVAEHK